MTIVRNCETIVTPTVTNNNARKTTRISLENEISNNIGFEANNNNKVLRRNFTIVG